MLRIGTHTDHVIPDLNNFALCASHDDVIPDGVTQTFGCQSYGHFVIVQIEGWYQTLTMCEVKVFAR